ncbi:MAG: hypothetical protein ABR590_02275 [Spirochaetia bacterium]
MAKDFTVLSINVSEKKGHALPAGVPSRLYLPSALHAALLAGYMRKLITDEPSATVLADEFLLLGDM